jgi:anti-anti-sigma factor
MEYTESINGTTYKIGLSSKFTFADHNDFKSIIERVRSLDFKTIDIDFSNVTFIDSAALGLLLLLRDEAEKADAKVMLSHPQGQIKKMFDVSRFGEIFIVAE